MMVINQVSIIGLFDTYNYYIDFREAGDVTIITGPNGYGKTTILNIIYNLSRANLIYFLRTIFREIDVIFADGNRLQIERLVRKQEDSDDNEKSISLIFKLVNTSEIEVSRLEFGDDDVSLQHRKLANDILLEGETLYLNNNHSDAKHDDISISKDIAKKKGCEQFIMQLSEIKCGFINDSRLFSQTHNFRKERVEEVANAICEIIMQERDRFLSESQRINEKMVARLIDGATKSMTDIEYKSLADKLKTKVDMMSRFGIANDITVRPYEELMSKVLTVDLLGIEEKIRPCEKTLEKLQLFYELLTRKSLVNKRIVFDRRVGFWIKAAESGESIDLKRLSSGEKNEIIMIYNMIFATEDKSVLLVDEPENSLHVVWQASFMDDIEVVAEKKELQVIIATHSPTIIGERWNLTFDLFERNKVNE